MPTADFDRHQRRSLRLPGYDYAAAGAYFITLCAQDRACLFGAIDDGVMQLSSIGQIVVEAWQWLAEQYPYVRLDAWILMPNHIHGVIVIVGDSEAEDGVGAAREPPLQDAPPPNRKPLGGLIGAFKTVSTKRINVLRDTPSAKVWQRNYYEHIVRDEADLNRIREYIALNPVQWDDDQENPDRGTAP